MTGVMRHGIERGIVDKQTLVASVKEYLETDETTFNSYINQFIKLAEEDIYRKIQLKDTRRNATSSLTSSNPYIPLPSDFLSPYSFAVISDAGVYSYLQQKDVAFMREAFPNPTATSTHPTPRYYALFDDATFIVAPTPNDNFSVEMHYYYRPVSLADGADSGTTWLSVNGEQALLYGTIIQGYIFLKGDQDVLAEYKEQYIEALASLKVISEGRAEKDTRREPNARIET